MCHEPLRTPAFSGFVRLQEPSERQLLPLLHSLSGSPTVPSSSTGAALMIDCLAVLAIQELKKERDALLELLLRELAQEALLRSIPPPR